MLAIAGIPVMVGGMMLKFRAEENANYVVFDSPEADVSVKVDGRELSNELRLRIGPKGNGLPEGRTPLVAELQPGKHTVEILDAKGTVIESASLEAPKSGYRALYTVGAPRKYVFISVGYGRDVEGPDEVALLPGPSPHLTLLPATPITYRRDFDAINQKFPASVRTKGGSVLRGLCSLAEDETPECTFEQGREGRERLSGAGPSVAGRWGRLRETGRAP